jgi:hypothetical protein
VQSWNGYLRNYFDFASQTSAKVFLERGVPVLLEAEHVEGWGGDHLSVGVKIHNVNVSTLQAMGHPGRIDAEVQRLDVSVSTFEEIQELTFTDPRGLNFSSVVEVQEIHLNHTRVENASFVLCYGSSGQTCTWSLEWNCTARHIQEALRFQFGIKNASVEKWVTYVDEVTQEQETVFVDALTSSPTNTASIPASVLATLSAASISVNASSGVNGTGKECFSTGLYTTNLLLCIIK